MMRLGFSVAMILEWAADREKRAFVDFSTPAKGQSALHRTLTRADHAALVPVACLNGLYSSEIVSTARLPRTLASTKRGRSGDHLVDVVMPVMDGFELVERMRKIRPRLLILYMSAYPERAE